MRDIKFRAWDNNHKMWFYWNIDEPFSPVWDMSVPSSLDRKSLGQFTGLKDKNGKEIYEGDIVKYKPYYNLGHEDKYSVKNVIWGRTGDSDGYAHGKHYEWKVGHDSLADIADSDYPDEAYCEIIGNIYENPELLEK